MDRLVEMLDYYTENPPAHEILAAVHLKRKSQGKRPFNRDAAMAQLAQAGEHMGGMKSVSPQLRELAGWATEMAKKLGKKK